MWTRFWDWLTGRYSPTTADILNDFHSTMLALQDHVSALEGIIIDKKTKAANLLSEVGDHTVDKDHAEHVLDKFHDLILPPPAKVVQTPDT